MSVLQKAVRDIEERIGVRSGFFDDLEAEDDWSFIVKAHALVEAACAELLTEYVGSREVLDPFSRLELSDKRAGKMAFLRALSLLDDDERRFVSALSELRNVLVHNVRNTSFVLSVHVASLDAQQRKSFAHSFGFAFLPEKDHPEFAAVFQGVLSEPKSTIWKGLKFLLAIIHLQMETLRARREGKNAMAQVGEGYANANSTES